MADQGTGIDIGNDRNLRFFQIFVDHLLRPPIRADRGKLANNQPLDKRMRGFVVVGIGAVIADLGIGQDNDLAGVGGVGEDFLVTSQRGIKNYFPVTFAFRTVASAAEDPSIFQRKNCLHGFSGEWIL